MKPSDKKNKTVFNRAADNYIKGPEDVARALAAVQKRAGSRRDAEKAKAAKAARDAFLHFHRVLEPVFGILENLPKGSDNAAFFIRRDFDAKTGGKGEAPGKYIRVWLVYGRMRTAPQARGMPPDTHSVTFEDRNPPPGAKTTPRLRVALGVRPVMEIQVQPSAAGRDRIRSTVYKERYVRDDKGSRDGFREEHDVLRDAEHSSLRDAAAAVYDWVREVAPARVAEIRQALAVLERPELQDDMTVSRPISLRRKPPRAP